MDTVHVFINSCPRVHPTYSQELLCIEKMYSMD